MTFRHTLALSAALLASLSLHAQTPDEALRTRTDAASGVQYVQGGAGKDEMDAVKTMQAQYPFRLVFSRDGGEYVVPDHITVTAQGKTWLDVTQAGPALLAKLPPGRYSVQADYQGVAQKREVDVGPKSTTVNWRFNEAKSKASP